MISQKMKSGKEAALLKGNSYTNIAPFVKRYDGGNAGQNVYHVYTYRGNLYDFQYVYDNGIYDVIPMVDSYF